MNKNFPSAWSLGRVQHADQVKSATVQDASQQDTFTYTSTLFEARSRARQGSLLADVLFTGWSDSSKSDQVSMSQPCQNIGEPSSLSIKWFPISSLTRLEIGAHLAAMFDEPDGIRLVRAAIGMLEHLGLTSSVDICDALQMRLPELFAVPLAYPYDDALVLLRQYLLVVNQAVDGATNDGKQNLETHVPCGNCGYNWPLVSARSWVHFEFFVYGLGCPSCRTDFIECAVHPGDESVS